jgi:hypothetical protein
MPRIPLIAAALLLAAPAAAGAATEVRYDVVLEGSGSWTNIQHTADEFGREWTQRTTLNIGVHAVAPGVVFRDGRLADKAEVDNAMTITGTTKIINVSDDGTTTAQCTASSAAASGRSTLMPDLLTPLDGSEALVIRATDDIAPAWECTGELTLGPGGFDTSSILGDPGDGPMDAQFTLPPEAIGQGKVIQLVSGAPDTADQRCPGWDERTVECTGGWEGQLTFTRVGSDAAPAPVIDDDLLAPLVPPAPPSPPQITVDDLAPLVPPAKARLSRSGKTVSFSAGCSAGCRGTAALTVGPAGGRAAAAARTVARLRFKLAPGAPRTVTLRLPARARKALRRARRGTLAVTLRPPAGAARTVKLALKR